MSEADALARVVQGPGPIQRNDRSEVRTTTWAGFWADNPASRRSWRNPAVGPEPDTIVRVVAVSGIINLPAAVPTTYDWMIGVFDAETGEHYATQMENSPDAWPAFFDRLTPVRDTAGDQMS